MNDKNDLDKELRIGILDIETTGLQADFGYMLAACVKEVKKDDLSGPVHILRIDDKRNSDVTSDKWLIRELIKLMNSFDLIITWNGSRFDIPFINSRALKFRMKPPLRKFRRDLYFVARANGRLRSNRLAVWDEFLHGKALKTPVTPSIWNKAIRGDKDALDFITDHCVRDVISTEKVYKKLIPLLGKLKRG